MMKWPVYVFFALFSIVLAVISVAFWMINPITPLLLFLAAPPLRLVGYHPPVEGWSALGSVMYVGALWPLTLAPLHWLNFRVLRWGAVGYAGLLLIVNILIAMAYLVAKEGT
jgi:hypothetical protein